MAATASKLKPVSDPPRTKRSQAQRRRNQRAYGELVRRASEQGLVMPTGGGMAEVLQECLDRAVGGMRYAASEVDKLEPDEFWVSRYDAQGNRLTEPNKWYQLELACREEVERLAGMMAQLGLAERAVRVEEAKAALILSAIRDAARDAGLSSAQMKALGAGLRERLTAGEQAVAA